jgi:hypothetical protein
VAVECLDVADDYLVLETRTGNLSRLMRRAKRSTPGPATAGVGVWGNVFRRASGPSRWNATGTRPADGEKMGFRLDE